MEKLNFLKQNALLLLLLMAVGGAKAQVCDSIDVLGQRGWDACTPGSLLPIDDNQVLYQVYLYRQIDEYPYFQGAAYKYYWISRTPARVMDSAIVETEPWEMVTDLQATNPFDNGRGEFFRARVVERDGHSDLVITYFDRNLDFDTDNELVVPLSDTIVEYMRGDFCFDGHGDIVMTFALPSRGETHFVRIGLDGTLKHENIVPDTIIPIFIQDLPVLWEHMGLRQSGSAPLRYQFFGKSATSSTHLFQGYVLDSLFNVVKTYEMSSSGVTQPPYTTYHSLNRMAPSRDGGFVVVSGYERDVPPRLKTGIVVCKYDKDGNLLEHRYFKTIPEDNYPATGVIFVNMAMVADLIEVDGYYYMSYTTRGLKSVEGSYVSLVKMDEDLNIVWQRFFLEGSSEKHRLATDMFRLDDGSIAICGQNLINNTQGYGCFYYLFNEEGWGSPEAMAAVRPYAFWPNPVRDELRLQYSPDAKPAQAELYDLQGRLVLQQRTGLESLNLEGLAPGTYTLRVTLEGGKTFSDKVVKE